MHEQMLLVGQRYHQLCKRYPPIGRTAVLGKKRRAVGFIICLLLVLNLASRFGTHYFYSHADQEAWRFRGVIRWSVPDARYKQVSAVKAGMPRTNDFQGLTPDTLQQHVPIWVISLARATARRQSITRNLAAAGITNYELVDAADYWNASSISMAELHTYAHGWRRYMWYQNRTRYSGKVAVDMSHFRLWQRLAAADQPAIILEDDVKLTGPTFRKDLLTVLNELPQDWDVFYLKIGCCHKLGQNVSKHLRPVYGTAGAFSYMMTPSFARKALKAARDPRLNSWVDIILMSMGRHFEGNMYAVQPPLVLGNQSLNSTLTAHYIDPSKDTDWERKWMEFGHWGRLSGAAARWNSK